MTKKQVARNVKVAGLMHEIGVLSDQMAQAMIQAHLPYIAETGEMTLRMTEIWNSFIAVAIEGVKVGL